MSSEAARMRSTAPSRRLSSATSTGTTTSNKIALPIHHSTIGSSSSDRAGREGSEEAPEDAEQGQVECAQPDSQAAGRRRGTDLVRGQAFFDGADAHLHVGGEV